MSPAADQQLEQTQSEKNYFWLIKQADKDADVTLL